MKRLEIDKQTEEARIEDGGTSSEVGTVMAQLNEFEPDAKNANAGTHRGRAMVKDSLRRNGAGRSILVDRNGNIIAGNTTHEAAIDVGLTDAVIVKTDGRKLVVVQRMDLDLDSPIGRALAVADNRTSEVGLSWDADILAGLAGDPTLDLSTLFSPIELADLLHAAAPVPHFEPVVTAHRLDQLATDTTCPACGHTWHQGPAMSLQGASDHGGRR